MYRLSWLAWEAEAVRGADLSPPCGPDTCKGQRSLTGEYVGQGDGESCSQTTHERSPLSSRKGPESVPTWAKSLTGGSRRKPHLGWF